MTKRRNYLVVLCALMVAFTFLGAIFANTSTVSADTSSLQMVSGAFIRVRDAENDGEEILNTNGLRFTAEVSIDEYDGLVKDNKAVTVGTFIMPYKYIAKFGEINEASCFNGQTQVYTWKDKTVLDGTTDGTIEILHVAGLVDKQPSYINLGTDVYQINGSVVNIKPENLDLNYIGVSYIKVVGNDDSVNYIFAEAKESNSRSPIAVAQKALASETVTTDAKAVAQGYVEDYLESNGGSVTQTVNYEIYEANSTQGFDKVEAGSKQVVLDEVADFNSLQTIVTDRPNSVLLKSISDDTSIAIEFGKQQTVKYYYEKTIANAVIFDSSRATSASDLYSSNGATNNSDVHSAPSNAWGYSGNSSILLDDFGDDVNAGIIFDNVVTLPAPTDTFTMMVKNDAYYQQNTNTPNAMYISTGSDAAYGAFMLKAGANEVYQVTIKLNKPISAVKNFIFQVNHRRTTALELAEWSHGEYAGVYQPTNKINDTLYIGEYNPVYIDFIQAEYPVIAEDTSLTSVTLTADDISAGVKEITLPTYTSTMYSEKELSAGATVTYTKLPNGTAQPVTVVNGKVSIPVEESCTYQVNYNFNLGGVTKTASIIVYGYYPYMIDDFNNSTAVSTKPDYLNIVENASLSLDGSKFLRSLAKADIWGELTYATSPVNSTKNLSTMCMWIYSPSSEEVTITGPNASAPGGLITTYRVPEGSDNWGTPLAEALTLKPGWNYYELSLRNTQVWDNITNISALNFYSLAFGWDVRFDNIALK